MKSWIPRGGEFAAKLQNTAKPIAGTALAELMPDYVKNWLAQARLLYGVPFEYQVCDEHYLPVESMRFFYIDRNWTDALIDGALSIGTTSRDLLFKRTNIRDIQQTLDELEKTVRSGLRGVKPPQELSSDLISGFLLRSAVVSGYPGMDIKGYVDKARTQTLPILRIERLAPDILVCLFSGKPADVALQQPPEGLHFGVRQLDASKDVYSVILRQVSGDKVGLQFEPSQQADVSFRKNADGVLDISASVKSIGDKLLSLHQQLPSNVLDSSGFAIQMVRASGLQQFTTGVLPTQGNRE
ncbi:hypothetical protein PSECIP111951_03012 [Pseudoalteromonas holothuriae]|uniref:Uncharacterized protein n=1 Tax=Pseudoalteromonas holothuriae TaxID=2963714 RepID=A0A9W4R527_9GAMM|nr:MULTISPECIES: hypothetical protein [unclassified Pseudoalteromonas]CAH9063963.1 hypothetical protein PSECIP111951_03012 [Pseudoalteromonas sp. CIP111951]CAH9066844.1 hypothetical protein PSECIP111854_03970 [Pseudoalteromonas sp. CIP111854]